MARAMASRYLARAWRFALVATRLIALAAVESRDGTAAKAFEHILRLEHQYRATDLSGALDPPRLGSIP